MSARGRCLVIVAHPDDEVLMCGGTIARLSEAGTEVIVGFLSDGAQGRELVVPKVADLLGFEYLFSEFASTRFRLDGDLVTAVDEWIDDLRPSIVISHSQGYRQSQDHQIVGQAVEIGLIRCSHVDCHLLGEPTFWDFRFDPNLYVDIESTLELKLEALRLYAREDERSYFEPEICRIRAQWWGLARSFHPGTLCEAFQSGAITGEAVLGLS